LAGVSPQSPPTTFLHHTYYLARANKSPAASVVMPYIHRARSGTRNGPMNLDGKRNTICIDNDAGGIADMIHRSQLAQRLNNDLEVQVGYQVCHVGIYLSRRILCHRQF
jgi:hypothetical protein